MLLIKQSSIEVRLWLRRRETVMFSLALPILFLAFFGAVYGKDKVPGSHGLTYITYLVPGYTVYAIMAVALGTISANVANERFAGILKRLGGTPLPRPVLIAAKVVAAAALGGGVIGVIVCVGIFVYHVSLKGSQPAVILVLAVGIVTFAAIGITLGGIVKSEAAVAAGALLNLAFAFLGGVFIPRYQFPPELRKFSQYLPSERMVHAVQAIWTYNQGLSAVSQDLLVMGLWALAAIAIASRRFSWE